MPGTLNTRGLRTCRSNQNKIKYIIRMCILFSRPVHMGPQVQKIRIGKLKFSNHRWSPKIRIARKGGLGNYTIQQITLMKAQATGLQTTSANNQQITSTSKHTQTINQQITSMSKHTQTINQASQHYTPQELRLSGGDNHATQLGLPSIPGSNRQA